MPPGPLMPTRGPGAHSCTGPAGRVTVTAPPSASMPLCSRPNPMALASLAGPRASSASFLAVGRRGGPAPAPPRSPRPASAARESPLGPADQVRAEVHSVGEIHVEVAGRAEHDGVAVRHAPVAVGTGVRVRGIWRAKVGLHLAQPDDDGAFRTLMPHQRAQQVGRNLGGRGCAGAPGCRSGRSSSNSKLAGPRHFCASDAYHGNRICP